MQKLLVTVTQAGAAHNPAPARQKKAEPAGAPENGNCAVGLGRGKGSVGATSCEGGAGVPRGGAGSWPGTALALQRALCRAGCSLVVTSATAVAGSRWRDAFIPSLLRATGPPCPRDQGWSSLALWGVRTCGFSGLRITVLLPTPFSDSVCSAVLSRGVAVKRAGPGG